LGIEPYLPMLTNSIHEGHGQLQGQYNKFHTSYF
jgi:hypothetical protein